MTSFLRSTPRPAAAVLALTLLVGWSLVVQAGPAPLFDPEKHFTITAIEPDPASGEVRIQFSRPVFLPALRDHLHLQPPVKLDWRQSKVQPPDVLRLRGDFKYGQPHLIFLPLSLNIDGRTYCKTINRFVMPDRPPQLKFVSEKRVIERDSRQMLHLKILNVDKIKFSSLRVPLITLPLALAAEGGGDSVATTLHLLHAAAAQAEAAAADLEGLALFLGSPAEERQLFFTPGEKNKEIAFSLPLSFRRDKTEGALELIYVSAGETGSPSAGPALFRVTDLGLSYKLSSKNLLLWATSLKEGRPKPEVALLAFTRRSEAFYLGKTGSDGVFIFEPRRVEGLSLQPGGGFQKTSRRLEPEEIAFVAAAAPGDASYIEIRPQSALKPYGVSQVRPGQAKPRTLKGHLFTERGVYRPGERVMFKGTVRQFDQGRITAPEGQPCSLEMVNSKGEKIFQTQAALSSFGTVSGQVALKPYAPLGAYTLTMRYGPEKEDHTSRTFQVQEFRPPRHFVDITFERFQRRDESYVNQNPIRPFLRLKVAGRYYAGGPVKHGRVRWQVRAAGTDYTLSGFDDYTFGSPSPGQGEVLESGESILDERGRLEVDFPLEASVIQGRRGLEVSATVVDFDGRAAFGRQTYQARPEILIGLARHPKEIKAGQGQSLDVIAVKADGERIYAGVIQAEVLQESGVYVRKRNEAGDVYWNYETVWRRVFAADLPIKWGRATFEFDFAWGGHYCLSFTFRDEEGWAFSSATDYLITGDFYWDQYYDRDKPYESLPLSADKEAYRPGQTALIRLSPPEEMARCLVTVEREGVLDYRVLQPEGRRGEVKIDIEPRFAPNVYVSVLALKPRRGFPVHTGRYDEEAPGFYFGTINLPVKAETESFKLDIAADVKKLKARPGQPVSLKLRVRDQFDRGLEAEVAVGVVDESVLNLTGFATPSLEGLSRFDLPLEVFTDELRRLLVHQTPFGLVRREPMSGGGGLAKAAALEIKVRRHFNPVAFFDPAVATDAAGRAEVTFTLPDTMTTYRVYAVACDKGARFASRQRDLLAVKDFYLAPGLPRFLTAGDEFRFHVAAFNKTDARGSLDFEASASANLKLAPEATRIELPAQESAPLAVRGEALKAGPAKALFKGRLSGAGEAPTDAMEVSLPLNSGHVLGTNVFFGHFEGAVKKSFTLPPELARTDWESLDLSQASLILTLSGSPFIKMTAAINYLLSYPYGCVEQTSSAMLALASLGRIAQEGLIPGLKPEQVDDYLRQALDRLLSLQTFSGGFGYWPGYTRAHPWGSLYAGMALMAAAEAGLETPPPALKRLWKYLKSELKRREWSDVFRALACYVLALGQALDRPTFTSAGRSYQQQNRQAQLFLALAAQAGGLAQTGELAAWVRSLLRQPGFEQPADDFAASYREPAVALLAGAAILPDDPLTEAAALNLLGGLGPQGRWTSTSDTGWSLYALGKYFAGKRFGQGRAEVVVSQPEGRRETVSFEPQGFATVGLEAGLFLKNPTLELKTAPGESLLYTLALTAPRVDLASQSLSRGFKVRKEIENTGQGPIRVGDVVKVKVYVESFGQPHRYVVIDDPLPAGLVAVNPVLKAEEPLAEASISAGGAGYHSPDGWFGFWPHFFEIKDDRVLAFRDSLWEGRYEFSYYARAVCEGRFVLPSTKVALMYAPNVCAYTPRMRLSIQAGP